MKIINCVQGSPEWWRIRMGRPTSSQFSRLVTPAKWQPAAGSSSYLYELLGEILGERKAEFAGSPDIERGNRMEAEARRWLAMEIGEDIAEVGFCMSDCGRFGGSPDGLTPTKIPIEIKAPALRTYFAWKDEYLKSGAIPSEHIAQVHGHMIVTGADHCWFCFYPEHPSVNAIAARIERDEKTEKLEEIVRDFCGLLATKRVELIDDEAYHEDH